jgi:hypothetical protein
VVLVLCLEKAETPWCRLSLKSCVCVRVNVWYVCISDERKITICDFVTVNGKSRSLAWLNCSLYSDSTWSKSPSKRACNAYARAKCLYILLHGPRHNWSELFFIWIAVSHSKSVTYIVLLSTTYFSHVANAALPLHGFLCVWLAQFSSREFKICNEIRGLPRNVMKWVSLLLAPRGKEPISLGYYTENT